MLKIRGGGLSVIVSEREILSALNGGYRYEAVRRLSITMEKEKIPWYKSIISAIPPIRQERVFAIRADIMNSRYAINDYEVATKMVGRSLVDTIFADR